MYEKGLISLIDMGDFIKTYSSLKRSGLSHDEIAEIISTCFKSLCEIIGKSNEIYENKLVKNVRKRRKM